MKKILLYGFKPFKKFKKNISEEVVKNIDMKFKKVILPVVPKKEIILDKIKRYQPEIIIGIGQCRKGKLIRIERKAKNRYKTKEARKVKIDKRGRDQYLVNLKLKKIPGTKISYSAGEFLCNFSMYVIMDFIKKRGLKTEFAFLHIPRDYKARKAIRLIKKLISQIE